MVLPNRMALILCLATLSGASAQSTGKYHRFYQGYLVQAATDDKVEHAVNRDFLPLFPQARPHGLLAYRPAFTRSTGECKLPDWIALLTFKSEQVYTAYTKSEIGKKIRAAHAPVFDGKTSKSAVPEPFRGTVEYGKAYAVKSGFDDFTAAESALVVHCNPRVGPDKLPEETAKAYRVASSADCILFSLSAGHLAEYVFARRPRAIRKMIEERKSRFKSTFSDQLIIPLSKRKIGAERLKQGHGLDAQL